MTSEEEQKLLCVFSQVGPDVELKENPTTGEEYLLKAIEESKNTPNSLYKEHKPEEGPTIPIEEVLKIDFLIEIDLENYLF